MSKRRIDSPRITVVGAFWENAIAALALQLERESRLERLIVRDERALEASARAARLLWPLRKRAEVMIRRIHQRYSDFNQAEILRVAPSADIIRIVGGRRSSRLSHSFGNAEWKVVFGRAAARCDFGESDGVIGMPGSSLEHFRKHSEMFKVFHAIDSHPRSRNQALIECYGRRRAWSELYPESFVDRVDEELLLSDAILTPSVYVADQMRANRVSETQILPVQYGVSLDCFQPRSRPTNTIPRIIFVGQISLRKGVPFLLESIRNLNVELILVGPVFDARLLRDLPTNASAIGPVRRDELVALYQSSDLFILPSIDDASALVVAEAAASGLPIVTTTSNGSHEFLAGDRRVIASGDARAIREQVLDARPLDDCDRFEIARRTREVSGWPTWTDFAVKVLGEIDMRLRAGQAPSSEDL